MKQTELTNLYRVECSLGVTLVRADDGAAAEDYLEKKYGEEAGPYDATPATESDYSYVTSMGGCVHNAMRAARAKGES